MLRDLFGADVHGEQQGTKLVDGEELRLMALDVGVSRQKRKLIDMAAPQTRLHHAASNGAAVGGNRGGRSASRGGGSSGRGRGGAHAGVNNASASFR